jgi:hypothetical protein
VNLVMALLTAIGWRGFMRFMYANYGGRSSAE